MIAHPIAAACAVCLAVGEFAGDKQKSAPDRIVVIGLATRFLTSAVAGASLVPKQRRWLGASVGGLTAVLAAYPGWRARTGAMRSYGQTSTGLVEDAAVVLIATAIIRNFLPIRSKVRMRLHH